MATSQKLNLTRDQLAKFLTDHEQIRQFERLFATVDAIAPDFVNEVATLAGNADSKAIQALAAVASLSQEAMVAATTAENKAAQAMALLESLRADVDGLQAAPPPRELKMPRYGTFYDTTTQTAAAINTAYPITFDTTDLSRGVYRGSPTSRIIVDREGVYDFQFSAQLDNTSFGNHFIYIWCRKNGVDVTQSAGQVALKGTQAELVASWNFVLEMKALDYFELMWSVSDTDVRIFAQVATAPHPGIPSVILTVTNNIQGQT
jgi:hypothetical protein